MLVEYEYDAWGKCTVTSGASNAIANANPIRYRGYYYDTDTGFYYLQSRYYDPIVKRFISADGVISSVGGEILGYNQYAYSFNNPINFSDSSGNWPRWITATVAVAATALGIAAIATGNFVVAATAIKVAMVATTAYAIQTLHFDAREKHNEGMDQLTYEQAINIPGADTNVSDTFHDFSGNNNKVCLQDGREGIYDSSGKYVDDPRDIGTYNVFVPNDFGSTVGHIVIDVIPYLIFGNNDEDPGFIVNFAEKWANEFNALFK